MKLLAVSVHPQKGVQKLLLHFEENLFLYLDLREGEDSTEISKKLEEIIEILNDA